MRAPKGYHIYAGDACERPRRQAAHATPQPQAERRLVQRPGWMDGWMDGLGSRSIDKAQDR